jgi:thiol-disulfide isomerase/thioredoxin
MKKFTLAFTLFSLLLISHTTVGQATAMDVAQADCGDVSHHLYTELDAGKVVILDFVMLNCAPCIVGTNALENISSPYETSHPGRVKIYSFGFLNSYTCEQLTAWRDNNSFTHPVFNNGEGQVAYYGGMGMPTIVVVGTNEHKVFFKSIGYTPSVDKAIKAAIDSALLYNPTGMAEEITGDRFSVYPTFFSDRIYIDGDESLSGHEILITDAFGREVMKGSIPPGGKMAVPSAGFAKGLYILRIKGEEGVSEGKKLFRN